LKAGAAPNAARLLQSYLFSPEAQKLMVDFGGLRSFHALVKDPEGRKPLKEIKLMKDDPAAVEKQARRSRRSTRATSRCEGSRPPRPRRRVRRDPRAVRSGALPLVLLPVGWLVVFAFSDRKGHPTLANFRVLFTDNSFVDPLVTALGLAVS